MYILCYYTSRIAHLQMVVCILSCFVNFVYTYVGCIYDMCIEHISIGVCVFIVGYRYTGFDM